MQGISLTKVAVVLLIVKVWDAVNDPIFGFIFDKVKFKNGQKSLPWLRVAVALIPIVTIVLFAIPSGLSETGKLWWFGAAYVLWDTVYTLTDVPAYSMLTTMTANLAERTQLLSVNRIYSGAGVLIYGVVLPILIGEQVGLSASWAIVILSVFSALRGLWIVYALVPVIGMMISTVFYLFYKLNDKDVQIMASCNGGQITREEAEKLLSRKY